MTAHKLTCHCGAVELAISEKIDLDAAYRCDCSYCARRGAVMYAIAKSHVRVVKGQDMLSIYQWGTQTAKHYFCMRCGIYTHHRRFVDPSQFGLNVAAIEGINPRDLANVRWPAVSKR
jgi:hypothetical protein